MIKVLVSKEYENLFDNIRTEAANSIVLELVDFENPEKNLHPHLRKTNAIIGQINLSDQQYEIASKLNIIQTLSSGYDKIDITKAKRYNVVVANNNGANAISVAEHVLMLILALYRRLIFHDQSMKKGIWKNLKHTNIELNGKTLGIVGMGNVGKTLAQKASAMGVNVHYFDVIRQIEIEKKLRLKYEFPEELLKNSDIISYHVPKTKYTRQIINQNSLNQMRKGAILINTSRGFIQDEEAIYEALSKGKIFGAGLDVFEVEPLQKQSPLRKLNNVLLTPHSAPNKESYLRSIQNAIKNIIRVSKGMKPLSNLVDYDKMTYNFLKQYPKQKFFSSKL